MQDRGDYLPSSAFIGGFLTFEVFTSSARASSSKAAQGRPIHSASFSRQFGRGD